jgi:tetratricopeptide (TPR) repeat protein
MAIARPDTLSDPENWRSYQKLMVSIEASDGILNLLIAICDDRNLRDQLIQDYEAELRSQNILPYRIRLEAQQPSLRQTLAQLVESEPALQQGVGEAVSTENRAVITVLGADNLVGVRLNQDKSEQERFFFSLQWTREALREFKFPIVLWLSDAIATRLSRQAPDFWSWRGGVFEFVGQMAIAPAAPPAMPQMAQPQPKPVGSLPLADLQQQVAALEEQDARSPLLITLYRSLGDAYERQYRYHEALEQYEKSLLLAQSLKDLQGKADTLNQIGIVYDTLDRYQQAIELYQQSLSIRREIGDQQGEAILLGNLGVAYRSLGQYSQAIEFHQQSLNIAREIGDRQGEANSLGNLGIAYSSLGQYSQAIEFHQQSLNIAREIGDRRREANSLGNLGIAYSSLGQYSQAIELYQQSLIIKREIGDQRGEANSLYNLGNTFVKLGQNEKASDLFKEARQLYQAMNLDHEVETCDAPIRNLEQVVQP